MLNAGSEMGVPLTGAPAPDCPAQHRLISMKQRLGPTLWCDSHPCPIPRALCRALRCTTLCMQTKQKGGCEPCWTQRPGFGKAPMYLRRNAAAIAAEREQVEAYLRMQQPPVRCVCEWGGGRV